VFAGPHVSYIRLVLQVVRSCVPWVLSELSLFSSTRIRGADVKLASCLSSSRNVCPMGLGDDELIVFDGNATGLTRFADTVPKPFQNDCTVLLMWQCAAGDRVHRRFALLAKTVLNPKYQVYILCEWASSNTTSSDLPELAYTFELRILASVTRISKEIRCIHFITSDELALMLTRISIGTWSVSKLRYTIPHDTNLLRMVVDGALSAPCQLAKSLKVSAATSAKRSSSTALNQLDALRQNAFAAGRARAAQFGSLSIFTWAMGSFKSIQSSNESRNNHIHRSPRLIHSHTTMQTHIVGLPI
jgi:hypothetical protein